MYQQNSRNGPCPQGAWILIAERGIRMENKQTGNIFGNCRDHNRNSHTVIKQLSEIIHFKILVQNWPLVHAQTTQNYYYKYVFKIYLISPSKQSSFQCWQEMNVWWDDVQHLLSQKSIVLQTKGCTWTWRTIYDYGWGHSILSNQREQDNIIAVRSILHTWPNFSQTQLTCL